MAFPDALTFAGANQAPLNSGGGQELGKGANLFLAFWEVAAD
jgi:hypothetical protein